MRDLTHKLASVFFKIPQDKLLHFCVGYLIAATLFNFSPLIIWGVVTTVAVAKELIDYKLDWLDIVATVLGALPIILIKVCL